MTPTLVAIDRRLRVGIDGAAALLLAAVPLLGIAQVVARYAFNSSLVWSEEAIRLLHVWLVLVAAASAPHMRIGLIADRLRDPAATAPGVFGTLATLALLVHGALTLNARLGADRYVTLGLSKSWYWTGAVVGALLWMGTTFSALLAGLEREASPAADVPGERR